MKKLLVFGLLSTVLWSCNSNETTTEETIEVQEEEVITGDSYGPEEVNPAEAISVAEMLADYEGKSEEKAYTFKASIEEVCSKAGCWINVDKGNGETFMVMFKDHFTIPIDTKLQSTAYLHGVAYWDTVSVDMLKHFAEDAGKSQEEIDAITEPKFELGFEADGILIPTSK